MPELFQDTLSSSLIPTKVASEISGYNADYLARLCREKKIEGTQIGRSWLINRSSLEAFVAEQEGRKKQRAEELRAQRGKEYRKAQKPVLKAALSKTADMRDLVTRSVADGVTASRTRAEGFARAAQDVVRSRPHSTQYTHSPRLAALAVALAVVAGSAYASTDARTLSFVNAVPNHLVRIAFHLSPGTVRSSSFRITEADAPANLAASVPTVPSAHDASRAVALLMPDANVAALASVRELADEARTPFTQTDVASVAATRIASASDIAQHPLSSLVRAYVLTGESFYNAGARIANVYTAGINVVGDRSLARAATLRDGIAFLPRVTNAILDGYANGVYAFNDTATKAPGTAMLALYTLGDSISSRAASVPVFALRAQDAVIANAGETAHVGALALAHTSSNVQAPLAAVSAAPATQKASSTVAATASSSFATTLTRPFTSLYAKATSFEGAILSLPVQAENTMLGFAGYASSLLDGNEAVATTASSTSSASHIAFTTETTNASTTAVVPNSSLSASALSFLPALWQFVFPHFFHSAGVLASSFISSAFHSLTNFVPGGTTIAPTLTVLHTGPTETLALPIPANVTHGGGSTGIAYVDTGSHTVVQNIINNYFPGAIVGSAFNDAVLAVVRPFVNDSINASLKNNRGGGSSSNSSTSGSTGGVNSDGATLTNVTISSGTATLSTLTSTNSSLGSASATSLGVTGTSSLATTTITGDLTVTGTFNVGTLAVSNLSSNNAVIAPYFTATSTSATSTFPNLSATNADLTALHTGQLTLGTSAFTSFLGTGLANVGGVLSVSTSSFSGAGSNFNADLLDGYDAAYLLANSFSTSSADAWLTHETTDALAEGTTSLYFTNARARAALSVTGTGLTYSSTTGALAIASGYAIPLAASTTEWSTAYLNRITAANSPLSITNNTLSISQASSSTDGYLSSTDWNAFNAKQAALAFTYPLLNTANTISLAFGTSTSNTWGGTQTFTNAPVLGSLTGFLKASAGVLSTSLIDLSTDVSSTLPVSHGGTGSTSLTGLLKGNGTSAVLSAVSGVDYAPATSGTSLLYGNNAGGFSNASIGAGLSFTGGTLTNTIAYPFPSDATSTQIAFNGGLKLGNITGTTQCLRVDSAGVISGAGADCGTTSGGLTTVTSDYPLVGLGTTGSHLSLAFGTSTSNTWGGTQTFTNAPVLGSLTGVIYGNSGTLATTGTSTTSLGAGLSYSGTLGSFVGGTNGTLSISTSTISGSGSNFNADFLDGLDSTYLLANSFSSTSAAYYLAQNAISGFSTTSANYWLTGKTTTDLAEGTNLYYTDARADARINATSTIGTLTSAPNLGTVKTTLTGILKATSGVLSNAVAGTDYENPLTFTYPLQRTTNTISLAFGTTTANSWSALQTFSAGINVGASTFTSLLGTGLSNVGGALTVATSSFSGAGSNLNADFLDGLDSTYFLANSFSTTSANYYKSQNNFYSTTSADYWLTGKTTTNLTEGSNLYFTNARADARINATSTIGTLTSAPNLGTLSTTLTGILKATSGVLSNAVAGTDYESPLTFGYPLVRTTNAISLAFGTTTANAWSSLQTFNGGVKVGSLSGVLYGNSGTVAAAATSTATLGTGLSYSGTLGGFVGGTSGTLSVSTSSFSGAGSNFNADLLDGLDSTYFLANAFSTTSANYWKGQNNFYSTTSADYWLTGKTTDNLTQGSTNKYYSDTLATANFISNLAATTSVASITTLGNLSLPLTQTTGTLAQGRGGTGITTYTAGDILYADNSGNLAVLPVGSTGQVLKVQAGLPSWGVDQTIGGGGSDGIFATSSGKIYPLDTSNVLLVGTNATSTTNSIFEVNGIQYISSKLGIATTSPSTALSVAGNGLFSGTVTAGNIIGSGLTTNTLLYADGSKQLASATLGTGLSFSGGALSVSTTSISGSGSNFNADLLDGLDSTYFLANAFSTTSANYWKTQNNFYSTTSADYWLTGKTTDNLTEGTTNLYWTNTRFDNRLSATTSLPNLTTLANLDTVKTSLTGILKATSGVLSNAVAGTDYQVPLAFTYPLVNSSNTISLAFGTTTANAWSALQTFSGGINVGASTFTSLLGTGLSNVGGTLTVATSSFSGSSSNFNADLLDGLDSTYFLANAFSTTSANYWKGQNNFYSTTSADYWLTGKTTTNLAEGTNLYYTDARVNTYVAASTTIPKTYTSNVFSGNNTFNGSLSIGTLNGPLQANNGVVSATSSVGVLYGGTGLASAPTYGQVLVGNGSGGYSLTATSSLGLAAAFTANYPIQYSANVLSLAFGTTTSNTWAGTQTFTNPVAIGSGSGTSTVSGNIDVSGGVKAGTLSGLIYGNAGLLSAATVSSPLSFSAGTLSLSTAGDWTGTFDGQEGAYYLANSFSTTSANYWKTQNNFYSTTSADYWLTTKSTTNLAEGTNLYFTNARADARINATSTIGTLTSAPNLGTLSTTLTGILKATSGVLSNAVAGTDYQVPLAFTYPLVNSSNTISLAFGTTTANSWSSLQTFNGGVKVGSLSGVFYGAAGTLNSVSTSTPTLGTGLSYSGTLGSFIGGTSGTLSISTSTISGSGSNFNADLLDGLDSTYFLANSFSTTSAAYWKTQNNFYSTTSADYWLTGKTTADLAEGSNLYFTNARADARINATSTIGTLTSAPNLGTIKTSLTGILKATAGVLSNAVAGTDYENPLTFTYPLQRTTNTISLAFGTTTANSWSALQTFNSIQISGNTFTSLLGSGLSNVGGVLSVSTSSFSGPGSNLNADFLDSLDSTYFLANSFSTTSANYWKGQNNFYSTTSADYWLTGKTTTNLAEGTNLYFTNARADARINATSTIGTLTSAPNLGTVSTALSGLLKATSGVLSNAVSGTDYAPATVGSGLLFGNGSGGFSAGSVSSPLTLIGTTLGIQQADNTQPGYLSSTDWSTFNGKQDALTGTTGQFPYFSGTNTVTATSSIFLAANGNVGIGTASPGSQLTLSGDSPFVSLGWANSTEAGGITFNEGGSYQGAIYSTGSAYSSLTADSLIFDSLQDFEFHPNGNVFSSAAFVIKANGNVGVGTTSPFTKFGVTGNTYLGGNLTATGAIAFTGLSTGLVKSTSGTLSTATAGTDYAPATTGSSILAGNGAGGFSAVSVSSPLTFVGTTLGIQKADNTQPGYLSSTDWTTFNGKQDALAFTYPLVNSSNTVSLAFGTTTTNTWSSLQTFNGGIKVGALSGVFYGGSGTLNSVSTSTPTLGTGLSYSGTLGSFVGGTSGTLSISTSSFSGSGSNFNADLLDGQDGTYYLNRANHTGTQLAATISDFSTTARGLFSSTATGLTYTSGTGVFSLTAGYTIPLTASTTDWNTAYLNRITSATYPLQISSNVLSLAFGTTTANSWSSLQTFNGGITTAGTVTLGSLTGVLHASSGVVSASNVNLASEVTGTLPVANGGTGSTTLTGLLKGNGTGSVQTAIAGTDYQAAGNYITALTGDVTASGPGSAAATLATVNSNVGSFGGSTAIPTFTVNAKGLITAAGSAAVIAPAGTLTGTTLASGVTASSLTSVGTLTALTVSGNTTLANATSTNLFSGRLTANAAAFGQTGSTTIASTGALTTPSLTIGSLSGLLYANSGAVAAATVSSPLTYSAGTLGIQVANTSQSGYLTNTDWNTFNGKQSAVTGTTGQFPYFSATNTLTATSSLFLATSGYVGIGSTTPNSKLSVGASQVGYAASFFNDGNTTSNAGILIQSGEDTESSTANPFIQFADGNGTTIGSIAGASSFLQIQGNSGLSLGSGADASVFALGNVDIFGGNGITLEGNGNDLIFTTSVGTALTIKATNNNVGIGTTSPFAKLSVAGSTYLGGNLTATGTIAFTGLSSGLVKSTSGTLSTATAGTDYQAPITLTTTGTSGAATFTSNTLNIPQYQAAGTYVTSISVASANGFTGSSSGGATPALTIGTSITGLLKGNGTAISAAVAGTDYQAPITGTTGQFPYFSGTNTLTATSSLYLATSGNIGIGTTSPLSQLTLDSSSAVGQLYINNTGASNNISINLARNNTVKALAGVAGATNGIITGSVLDDFAVRTAGGNILFSTDSGTTAQLYLKNGGNIGIGTTTPTAKLALAGGNFLQSVTTAPVVAGSVSITSASNGIGTYVQGHYAYSVDAGSGFKLSVIDITVPSAPVVVGTVTDVTNLAGAFTVKVAGNYAYVTATTGGRLTVVDISNPSSPAVVGVLTNSALGGARGLYLAGQYAYVVGNTSGALAIVNISNPTAPVLTGSVTSSGNLDAADSVYVSGKYAYVTSTTNNKMTVVDISNPTAPSVVGSYASVTNISNPKAVWTAGQYAYVLGQNSNSLAVINVSNPASPTLTSVLFDSTNLNNPKDIFIAGRYAYITSNSGNRFTVVDISNPAAPFVASSLLDATNLNNPRGIFISGKYAYVSAGSKFTVLDIAGIDVPSANLGVANTEALSVYENGDIGNDLFVRNGLTVGSGGIYSGGSLSVLGTPGVNPFTVASSSGTNLLTLTGAGNLGLGTTSPFATLSVASVAGAYPFAIGSSTNPVFTVLPSGGVSVGTIAETIASSGFLNTRGDLFASGSLASEGVIYTDSGLNLNGASILDSTANLLNLGGTIRSATGNGLSLQTNGASTGRLVIDTAGNVGIGTTSPWSAFSVNGTSVFASDIIQGNNPVNPGTGTTHSNLILNNVITDPSQQEHSLYVQSSIAAISAANTNRMFAIHGRLVPDPTNTKDWTNGNISAGIYAETSTASLTTASGTITRIGGLSVFTANTSPSLVYTNSLGIQVTANYTSTVTNAAGIAVQQLSGATNSTALLLGTISIPTGNYSIYDATALPSYLSGNLGLGTTSPYAQLALGGGNLVLGAATAGGTPGDLFLPKLGTGAGAFLAVDATGKVIATTTPAGGSLTGTTGQVAYFSGTNTAVGTSTLFISTAGRVGIGQTSPTALLHITGTQPAASTAGTAATDVLKITGAAGGDNNATSGTAFAGTGAGVSIAAGNGGSITGTPSSGFGGTGGSIVLTAGSGGVGGGTSASAGSAGGITLTAGSAGNTSGGVGGDITIAGGSASGAGTSGGMVYISGGSGLSNPTGAGNVLFGLTSAISTPRGLVGIGTTTPWGLLSVNPVATNMPSGAPEFVIGSSSATHLLLNSQGYLGLGTTSPYAQLALGGGNLVLGAATAGGTPGDLFLPKLGTGAGAFLAVDATGKVIATTTPAGGSLTGTTGQVAYFSGTNTAVGTSTLTIDTTGRVGVGTTSPSAQLDVWGSLNVATGSTPALTVNTTTGGVGINTATTNGTSKLIVNSAAVIGGTSNVQGSTLYVNGNGWFNSGLTANNSSSANATPLTVLNGIGPSTANVQTNLALNATNQAFSLVTYASISAFVTATSTGAESGDFAINTRNSGTVSEKLRVTAAGNVGIGTSTPWSGYKLAVNGSTIFHIGTGNNLAFDSNGISAIDDSGATAPMIITGGTATLQATADANVKSLAIGAVRLSTAAGEKLTVTSGGNVGIASTTPTSAFSVGVDSYFGGNVGIGSSSPTAALSFAAGGTTAAKGINFGDGTANLYRSAAGTIKTDGGLNVGSGVITGLTPAILTTGGFTAFQNVDNAGLNAIAGSGTSISETVATGLRAVLNLGGVLTWAPNSASNSSIFNGLLVAPTVNAGGSNVGGTFYAARINPTLTSTTGLSSVYLFAAGVGSSDKFVINSTGLVGAGTTTPAGAQIVASNSTLPQVLLTDGSLTNNQWGFRNAGGNLYIATTSPSTNATSTATAFTIASDGGLVAYNATGGSKGIGTINAQTVYANNVALTSDARYKTDIQALDSSEGLDFIQSLAPVSYHWANPNMGTDINFGFLAQDVQKIAPQLVSVGNDKDHTLALNYIGLISPAIKAIQELAVQTSDLSLATTSLATQFASLSASVTTSLSNIQLPHALTATNVTADSMTIAQGVSAGTLTTQSANVDGTVSAARYVVPLTANVFSFGSTTISAHAPSEALASGGTVDLYKLASYASAGVDALATRTGLLAVKIDDLTSRIAALEALHSATTTASTTDGTSAEGALGLTITTIQDALKGLGIIIHKGYLALDSLVTHQLFLVKGEDGTSSTGSQVIPAGATTLNVTNPLVHPSSKIFLTFTSSVDGSWYLSKKQEGSFTITLAKPQPADTEFDYFLLQTDPNAQVAAVDQASQPPVGASEAPTVPPSTSQDGGPTVSLNGSAAIQLAQGATWTDPGAHAAAADGTDLTSSITVAGSVDTNTAGLYTLTYNVVDAAGKGGQASRVVSVLAPTSAPSGGTTVTDNSGTTGGTGSGTSAGSNTGSTASTGTSGGTATTGGTTPTSGDTAATSGGTTASTGTTGTTGGTTADAGGSTGSSAGTTVSAGTDTTPAS